MLGLTRLKGRVVDEQSRVEVHGRIVARVSALMEEHDLSTRDIGDLLGLDRSGVMRRLLLDPDRSGPPGRWRLVEWRAWEVARISEEFGVPLQEFFHST